MEKPTTLSFTDLEVPVDSLFRRAEQGPMNLTWTRTQFAIPDTYNAPRAIEAWLGENCPGRWAAYSYQDPKGKGEDHVMVVRFEDKNDALMFKLRGGHQAFENS